MLVEDVAAAEEAEVRRGRDMGCLAAGCCKDDVDVVLSLRLGYSGGMEKRETSTAGEGGGDDGA